MIEMTLRMADLTARFAVNRRTIHRWIADHGFPKGAGRLGCKGKFWSSRQVDEWARVNRAELSASLEAV